MITMHKKFVAGVIWKISKDYFQKDKAWYTCSHCGYKCHDYIAHAYFKQLPADIYAQHIVKVKDLAGGPPMFTIIDRDISSFDASYGGHNNDVVLDYVYAVRLCFNCCRKFGVPVYNSYEELEKKALDPYYEFAEISKIDRQEPKLWL